MDAHYKQVVSSLNMNGENSLIDSVFFEKITTEQLLNITTSLFTHFLHDSLTQRFRKLLTTCQYDNPKLAQIFTSQYVTAPLTYQTQLFSLLTEKHIIHGVDPSILALQFFSPIYYLLVLCDRELEKEDWALQLLKEHILQFNKIYVNAPSRMLCDQLSAFYPFCGLVCITLVCIYIKDHFTKPLRTGIYLFALVLVLHLNNTSVL